MLAVAAKQRDKRFIDLLNKVSVGNIDGDVKNYLRQYLYMNLVRIIQKMHSICMQRMNQLRKRMKLV